MFSFVEDIVKNSGTDLETISTLEFDMDGDIDTYTDTYSELVCDSDTLNSDSFDVEQNSDSLSQQVSQEWEEELVDGVVFTYQEMVNILHFYDNVKKNKFNQTKGRFKKIKHSKTITRLRAYVEKKSTTFQKFKQVEKFVLERFENARSSMIHVNEMDLRRWAMSKSREIDLKFKASPKWIMDFKVRNRIVGRKITKYLTMGEHQNLDRVENEACEFVQTLNENRVGIEEKNIYNLDQASRTNTRQDGPFRTRVKRIRSE